MLRNVMGIFTICCTPSPHLLFYVSEQFRLLVNVVEQQAHIDIIHFTDRHPCKPQRCTASHISQEVYSIILICRDFVNQLLPNDF